MSMDICHSFPLFSPFWPWLDFLAAAVKCLVSAKCIFFLHLFFFSLPFEGRFVLSLPKQNPHPQLT